MRVLALDTTGARASLALVEDARTVAEITLESTDGFGHLLFGAMLDLLAAHGWTLPDVDLFAAASGPGSFTGVRVGLTAVKGLAEAHGKPAAGISNLQALASFGTRPLRAVWMDARRGDIFGAVYDDALRLVQAECVAKHDAWLAELPAGELEILHEPRPLAAAIARIALRHGGGDPAALDANYVRRSDAELFWKDA